MFSVTAAKHRSVARWEWLEADVPLAHLLQRDPSQQGVDTAVRQVTAVPSCVDATVHGGSDGLCISIFLRVLE